MGRAVSEERWSRALDVCSAVCSRVGKTRDKGVCCLSCNEKLRVQIGDAAHRQQFRSCTPTQSHLLGIGTAGIGDHGDLDSTT